MNYPGKEIVQIYITLPQNGEAREYQRLAGFAKTDVLAPGECQELTVEVDQSQLAVFSKKAQGWIVEAGYYGIWTGKSSADRKQQAFLVVEKEAMLCKTYPIGEKETDYGELLPPESLKARAEQWTRVGKQLNLPEYGFLPVKEVITQQECALADETYRTEDLIPLLYGNVTKGTSTLGSAGTRVPGSAGETSEELEKSAGIRSLIMADGPAGLRLRQCYQVDRKTDTVYGVGVLGTLENGFLEPMEYHEDADTYYQFCTAFPVGTALAQTWNLELIEEFGRAVAEEMREYYVDLWLAPGLNIHRNPLCGRNFEYYSEDPLVSGLVAAAVTDGVQSMSGCAVTIKHFACNNQEDNRMGVDSRVSEKALREIYLRGFEITRAQFLNPRDKPYILITHKLLKFNLIALQKFQNIDYIELLIHTVEGLLAIRPSTKEKRNCMKWSRLSDIKKVPKGIGSAAFIPTLYELCGWNPKYTYRCLGQFHQKGEEMVLVFNLKEPEVFIPTSEDRNSNDTHPRSDYFGSSSKSLLAYPADWRHTFGNNFYHQSQAAEMAAFSQSQEWNTQNEGVPYHTEHLNVTPPDKAREEIHQIIQDITQEEPYERVTDR